MATSTAPAPTRNVANPAWLPFAALFVGLLAASSASILIRFAQESGASSLLIAAWRLGLATLILTPFVLANHRADLRNLTRGQIGLAMLAGVFLAIHFAAWITSLEYTSVLISVTLVTTNPLMVALATPFILREKLSRVTLGAIFLAMIGGLVISVGGDAGTAPRQDSPLLGVVLSLVGAAAVAAYFIIGRRLRATIPALPYIWLTYGGGAVILVPVVLLTGQPIGGLAPEAYLWMTLCALIPQLIGHSSFNYALGYLSAVFVSLIVLGEPIFSTILAVFLLQETPKPLQLAGSALILVALLIASREEARIESERQRPSPALQAADEPVG